MPNSNPVKYIKIAALCVIAAVLNNIIFPLFVLVLKLPLFVDTVFTAVITFSAGLIPGLVTALLTWIIGFTVKNDIVHPFVLCGIAEVFIIFLLKPAVVNLPVRRSFRQGLTEERRRAVFVSILARLMLLYITVCIAISILGGVIDFVFYTVLPNIKLDYSAEDAFKEWFLQGYHSVLVVNILSRLPVNLVDRFIVIFGGYFISRAIIKFLKKNKVSV